MRDFLDKEERAVLIEAHRAEREKKLAYRINAILLLDEVYKYAEISMILFLDDTAIRRYEKEYKSGGLDALLTDNYKGGSSKLSIDQEKKLNEELRSKFDD